VNSLARSRGLRDSRSVFDARLHPAGLTDQDLETLRLFGVEGALVVSDATPHAQPDQLLAHFEELVSKELPRLERAGIRAWAALGVHPASVPRRGLSHVLEALPAFCKGGRVVAVGLIGLSKGDLAEVEALGEQLALAERLHLRAVITSPAHEREALTRRVLTLLKESSIPPGHVLVDCATARTVKLIRECGHWAGLTMHPDHLEVEKAVSLVCQLGPERLVLESAAGDGASELLAVARAVHRLQKAKLTRSVVARVSEDNATAFLGVQLAHA